MIKHENLIIDYKEYDSTSDLEPEYKHLIEQASGACLNAYSPYSGFRVGAAVKCKDGRVVTGNNQENAAYPSGLCAERVAVFTASSQMPNTEISHIAITVKTLNGDITDPVAPCGACRQVIAEYEHRQGSKIIVIFSSESGKTVVIDGISSLLPFAFNSNFLPVKS